MEVWEEASDVSCRSSVISDLDELEANLYSYVHHEKNHLFDEKYTSECSILPLEDDIPKLPLNYKDTILHTQAVSNEIELFEGDKNYGNNYLEMQCGGSHYHKKKSRDRFKNCRQNHCIEIADSRYNVINMGSDNHSPFHLTDGVFHTSSVTEAPKTIPNPVSSLKPCSSSPSVIDIISSSEEDLKNEPKHNKCPEKMPTCKEVIVIDDSDNEIKIELEKINTKRKKHKKNRNSELKTDIKLNTVKRRELESFDLESDAHFARLENANSMLPSHLQNTKKIQPVYQDPLCKSWTPQMAQFYDESWGGEYINLSEIQRSMSDEGWQVDLTDEFRAVRGTVRDRRYFGNSSKGWCSNCHERGHYRNECPQQIRSPGCHRCGSSKHPETRCNKRICLTCGESTIALVTACLPCRLWKKHGKKCNVCRQRGHPSSCCPDLWRRFHATVVPGQIVRPKKVLYKDIKNTYCCNCATKGHHAYQCKKNPFNEYIPIIPKVVSYKDPMNIKEIETRNIHGFSENWERVGSVAPEHRNRDVSNKKELKNEKKGIKRARTLDHESNSKSMKLSENNAKLLNQEMSDVDYGGITKRDAQETKKCQKVKFSKNEFKLQQMTIIKNFNNSCRNVHIDNIPLNHRQDSSENQIKSSKPKESRDRNKKKMAISTNNEGHFPKTIQTKQAVVSHNLPDIEIILSRKNYKQLIKPEGEVVLKYLSQKIKGITATLIHRPKGVVIFVGSKKNCINAKKLLLKILCKREMWNKVVKSNVIENGVHQRIDNCAEKLGNKINSATSKSRNLQLEIQNMPSNDTKNVRCTSRIGLNGYSQTFESSKVLNKDNNLSNKGKSLVHRFHNSNVKRAQQTIQGTARKFLSEKEIMPEKFKQFAEWALSMY